MNRLRSGSKTLAMIAARGAWTMVPAAALLAVAQRAGPTGQPVNRDAAELEAFNDRVKAYLDLRKYRFMGRNLILRDAKANVIVDFIHDAVRTARK